jgi:hypothetical protein
VNSSKHNNKTRGLLALAKTGGQDAVRRMESDDDYYIEQELEWMEARNRQESKYVWCDPLRF